MTCRSAIILLNMTLAPGTKLGPYEIGSPLGAGGMGEIYGARDTRLHRSVAIKILPAVLSADQDRLRRFEQEARSASSLNHPNIVTIYELDSTIPLITSPWSWCRERRCAS